MLKDEILKLEERLTLADSSQEIDTSYILNELLNDKVLIVGPKGELYNKEFILKAHGPARTPFDKVSVDQLEITPFMDSAIVHSLTTYHLNSQSFRLRFFRVWQKQNSKWQVVGGSTTMVT